jgi:hypothetical protein
MCIVASSLGTDRFRRSAAAPAALRSSASHDGFGERGDCEEFRDVTRRETERG